LSQSRKILAEVGRWLIVLSFLATPMVTLRPNGTATFGDIFLALAACVAALLVILRRQLPELPKWLWIGTGLLLLAIVLDKVFPANVTDLVETYYPTPYSSSLSTGLRLIAALVILPVTVGILADRESVIRYAVWAWVAGATASCLVAALDGLFGTGLQEALADNKEEVGNFLGAIPPRFVGLGVHPTSFSVTAVMVIPFVLALSRTRNRFLALSPAMLIIAIAVVFSASRVGYLGAVAVAALSLCLNSELRGMLRRPDLRTWGPIAVILGLSVVLLFQGPPAYKTDDSENKSVDNAAARLSSDGGVSDESNNVRVKFAKASVKAIARRPVVGYGFIWIESAHDIYLELMVSGGIFALVGFLLVYLGYIRRGIRLAGKVVGELDGFRVAAVISLGSYLVMGLVQPDLLDRYLYLAAGLIMALATVSAAGKPGSEPDELSP